MGTAPDRAATGRPLSHFPYSSSEPWSWMPGNWIQPGTVFITAENRFFRLVERIDDGWRAEEVSPSLVGDAKRLAEVSELRTSYERVLSTHDELDRRMRNGEDTTANRALLREKAAEMHGLRDRLVVLCNGSSTEARAAAAQPDRWKWALAAVLALGLLVAVAGSIRRLFAIVPGQAGRMVAGAAFFISAAALAVIGVRELARRRNKLVTGNLVGCYTLLAVGVIVAAFAVMFVSVLLLYRGAYD